MSRSRERADRINEHVDIIKVLYDYGYRIHMGDGGQEQQFSCDLHGDGRDSKPSARVYPESKSWYCFACHKSRDAIATVMAKEGCKFHEACSLLERKLGLPALPWEEYTPPPSPEEQVAAAFTQTLTFEDCRKRVERFLQMHTDERTFSMTKTLGLWEFFDQLCWQVEQESLSEDKGKQTLEQFRKKVQDRILEIHAQ